MPELENNMPELENNMPELENNMPELENNMPELENNMPEYKNKKLENNMPVFIKQKNLQFNLNLNCPMLTKRFGKNVVKQRFVGPTKARTLNLQYFDKSPNTMPSFMLL
ncbi:hypothetical protein CEXT_285771 [Caerostris extrusa]|uniref:Uncharacterized protein n=1 Tax=Caerostris extrusa TaxID=172846 RepID=A0AAV4V0I3_CAEEX|nr:hypothetical protein CEXT_285771 [Caerostris extrusa]